LKTAFSQGTHAEKPGMHRFGGLGLGLAISRALVEKQFGRIRAESGGRGRGASFIIEFPLIKNVEKKPDTETTTFRRIARKNPAGKNPVRHHILLVEDHEPTRTSLTQLLLRRNFKVTAAASLAEARERAGTEKIDLLISDIGLPDGNGFDLMKELHEQHGFKGVALTGYGMEQDMNRSYAAGFITHLTKPVRMESLDEVLAAVLGGKTNLVSCKI
jgi:CheY-like chemotaxis protein